MKTNFKHKEEQNCLCVFVRRLMKLVEQQEMKSFAFDEAKLSHINRL